MIQIHRENHTVLIQNGGITAAVDYSRGLRFMELSNTFSGKKANQDRDFFTLNVFGRDVGSDAFTCENVSYAKDAKMEMVTFLLSCEELCLKFRMHIIDEGACSIRLLYQLYDGYREGVPSEIFFHAPFLAALESGSGNETKYYPCSTVRDREGADVLHRMNETFFSSDIIMPFVVCDDRSGLGFSVSFPVPSDLSDLGSVQNVDYQLSRISDEASLRGHRVRLGPDASFNDTVEMVITGLREGWPEAFTRCREAWRELYDFEEYDREDLKWFRRCAVHNFTFLYGKEGFDHEKQKIDVEKLLKEVEAFGGFDTVILWNQYPRLGIDERTQWDFYDDFPGGREAIRAAVEEFHARGVKVLLPFIPWDRHEWESRESMGTELARIARDTDLDGFHLDTMKTLSHAVRKKLDAVKPGIELEPQGHPMKKRSMEYLTTSWDEFWTADPMPEVDVLRFMHPQHIAPVIGRWLRLEDKTTLIKRAEFGGAQIVIWQDFFGRWMPHNAAQKARIARWKRVYLQNLDTYLGKEPIPLYPTCTQDVFCNVFPSDDGKTQIYAFYNDNPAECTVRSLPLWHFEAAKAEVILGEGSAVLDSGNLTVTIPAKESLHVLVRSV